MTVGFLVLGIGLFVAALLFARWFSSADPAVLARALKWAAVILGALVVGFLVVTGRAGPAIALLGAALMLYRGLRGLPFQSGLSAGSRAQPAAGQTSQVETEYLRMQLDHDSGDTQGTVLKGAFAGRELNDLDLEALLTLYEEILRSDEQSARLLESFLERGPHDRWREALDTRRKAASSSVKGQMTRAEACEILGVGADASVTEIKAAHRRLMSVNHPDRGGSGYLAAKINLAKEVLLGT